MSRTVTTSSTRTSTRQQAPNTRSFLYKAPTTIKPTTSSQSVSNPSEQAAPVIPFLLNRKQVQRQVRQRVAAQTAADEQEEKQCHEEQKDGTIAKSTNGSGHKRRESKSVVWAEDVVDNEGLGRKSSKKCCIFHKQRRFDESSSESSGDDDDSDDQKSAAHSKHCHDHPHHNEDHTS